MKSIILIAISILCSCNNEQDIKYESHSLSEFHEDNLWFVASVLEKDIPNYNYKLSQNEGFYVENNDIIGVNIYNLNTGLANNEQFKNNNIYHISPINFQESFSYILCVLDNKMVLFKSINCKDKGNSFEQVLSFVKAKYSNRDDFISISKNLKKYRDFGIYLRTDSMTVLKCDCEPCE